MKLATIRYQEKVYTGVMRDSNFYALKDIDAKLPDNMLALIEEFDRCKPIIEAQLNKVQATCSLDEVEFLPPLPNPRSFRDFMGFEEHVKNAGFRDTGKPRDIPESWYNFPVFYFSNHNSLLGSGQPIPVHPKSKRMDIEFEMGFVIGKTGKNISAQEAGAHIFGFTIINDWSARDLQWEEMSSLLGPAKGKDFATSVGPVIVTKDEMDQYLCPDDPTRYNLATKLTRNGEVLRENNINTIYHPFASMIERASDNVVLYPGELFGSGTIGGGTFFEYPSDVPFAQAGDVIEMEIEGIGTLRSVIV